MARFTLTDYGRTALNAAMASETKITITSVKTSDVTTFTTDTYPDFTNTVQTVLPSAISLKSDVGTALITAVFTNTSLTAEYAIKAVGLYATCAGNYSMSTPRLYGYCILDNADSMPLPTSEPINYTYLINTKVSEASAITIEMTEGAYASASDFSELTNLVHTNEPQRIRVRINNTTTPADKTGFNYIQDVPIQGITENYWVEPSVTGGAYNGVYEAETMTDKIRLRFVTQPATSVYITLVYFKTYP